MSGGGERRDVYIRGSGSLAPPVVRDTAAMVDALLARTPAAAVGVEAREQYAVKATRVAEKTGIRARRFFPVERPLDDILLELAQRVAPPGFDWSRLDAILCASTSVGGFPGASQRVLLRLRAVAPELGDPFVLDLNSNACTNFLYALGIAASLIEARGYRNVLCLAVELASRCMTHDVREADTSMLFGDAAAGLLLSAEEGFARVLAPRMGSRVSAGSLELLVGGSVHPGRATGEAAVLPAWRIPGPEVAQRATALLVDEIAARRAGGEAFDWLLPHQANESLILAPVCAQAGVSRERLLLSLHEHGNTSSASMPLTFDLHRRAGRFSAGERVLMVGFGASMTVGSAIVEFIASAGDRAVTAAPRAAVAAREELVAIVGMAARLPMAASVEEFWANLAAGRDCTGDVPADRWDVEQWYDPDPLAANRTYCRRGGYVPDVHAFDARFFQVSPAEAVVLDPQHRLFYEVAYEALERAGRVGPGLAGVRTGVYVGTSGQENAQYIAESGADITASFVSGNTFSILANRLSYLLDLHGPSFVADTACSSALTVLHLARQAILAGEIDCALVGAVSLNLSPYKYISFAKAGMLAPDGRCKTFSAAADGYVPGEGVGAVVLRRLSDALRDGDTILGVIRGSGINQDGRSNGLTAPNPAAQRALYDEVYRRAGIDPATIGYVEAHGTGTALGDPIEVAALSAVFARHTARRQFCAIGSVKTNIGHLEPAAGVAGLIKLLLCLRHETLPPTLNLDVPSPHIGFVDTPFYPVVRATPWPRGAAPRRAAVSAMSFGGVNTHVVVEEAPDSPAPPEPPRALEVVPLSGRTPRALQAVAGRLAARLAAGPGLALADVALTLATGREHFDRRHAVVVGSLAELEAQLVAPIAGAATRVRQVEAVLSGETAGAAAALRGLVAREPEVAELWRAAGSPAGLDDAGALVLLQAGLLRLWTAWLAGKPPTAPEGATAVRLARGAITAAEALRAVAGRVGADMAERTGPGGHVPGDGRVGADMAERTGPGGHVPGDGQVALGVAGAGERALAERLAALYRAGAAIDWLAVHAARRGRRVELPTYPYERQVYERPRSGRRRPKQVREAGAAAAVVRAAGPPTEPALPLWEVAWTERPAPTSEPLAPRAWLVFEDSLGFAATLGERLAASGARVIRVRPGPGLDEVGPDLYTLRPTAPDEYVGLLAALQGQGVLPAVVHLWGCGPGGDALADPAEARALALLHLLQALAQQGRRRERLPVCVVTSDAAPVGGPSQPDGGGVGGLLRTAARELPQLAMRWVDVAGDAAPATTAGQVLGELAAPVGDGLRVAAWRGERRRAPTLVAAAVRGASPLRERGVYWITGGLGAVGRALALHLARRVRARLVLGGRTPLPERAAWAKLAADEGDPAGRVVRDLLAIEAAGGEVLVTRADVAEALQVRAALRAIEGRFGALHGVIHAAGVTRDGLLRAKTPAQVHEVLRPKWTGARCLLTALGERPLDFVALMGSLAGVFGNVGQVDYALANGLLDGLAHARATAGRRVVALDWSLWAGEGMGAGLAETARARGVPPLAPARAVAAFEAALQVGAPQVVIAEFTGEPPALSADGEAERSAGRTAGAGVEDRSEGTGEGAAVGSAEAGAEDRSEGTGDGAAVGIAEAGVEDRSEGTGEVAGAPGRGVGAVGVAGAGAEDRSEGAGEVAVRGERVEQWLLRLISWETDLPEEEIGVDTKFLELGVDSILAVKVLMAVEAGLGEKLSRSLMFDYFTVERLAAHLVETYPGRLAAIPGLASVGRDARAVGGAPVASPAVVGAAAPVASPVVGAVVAAAPVASPVVGLVGNAAPVVAGAVVGAAPVVGAGVAAAPVVGAVVGAAPVVGAGVAAAPVVSPVVGAAPVTSPVVGAAPVVGAGVAAAPVVSPVVGAAPVTSPVVGAAPVVGAVVGAAPVTSPVVGPGGVSAAPGDPRQSSESWLLARVAAILDLPAGKIGLDTKFLEAGIDSILAVNLLIELEEELGVKLSPSLIFDYFTVERLAEHLVERFPQALAAAIRGGAQVARGDPPRGAAPDVAVREDMARATGAAPAVREDMSRVTGETAAVREDMARATGAASAVREDMSRATGAAAAVREDMARATGAASAVREDMSRGTGPGAGAEDTSRAAEDDAVAVIGIACRFPGADDPETFWRNLCGGVDSVREAPAERIDRARWYSPDPRAPNRTYCTRGGWLDPIDRFDAAFFRLSPREADMMLPMQRMFLEVAWEALEDAGHAGPRASRLVTGVYAGLVTVDSLEAQSEKQGFDCTPTAATGSAMSVVANRVSYLFDLSGPSLVLDTACSSALVATHLACQALRAGECELALVGGINLGITPGRLVAFAQAGFFAADGRCKPFDDRGDGYVCGEGVAAVVLKPLRRALADGDPVYAVIRGTAVNQDGLTSGLTAPNSRAQERVLRAAYARAKVDPASVGYVEAHGTGTALGDPIELRALSAVFAGQPRGACGLGSVKGNLGHLEGAAGLASLIKGCLMLRHATLVPSLHFERPSRHVDLAHSPFFVVDRARPWPRRGSTPRRAGVSSFGFGGTNAHAVLEEAPPVAAAEEPARGRHLLVLSAHTPSALTTLVGRWRRLCDDPSAPPLASLCVSAATGRAARAHRLAVVAGSRAELAKKLAEETAWIRGEVDARRRPRVAFMCSGQGSQQPRMAEALYRGEPGFRAALDRCAEILRPHLEVPLRTLLFPPPGEERSLEQTRYTQPAVFAVDWSLAQMWIGWGVAPSAVIGHSLGEYVAACLAGVMTIEEALPLVAARARLMQALPTGGAMAAVMAAAGELEPALRGREDVEIAAFNGPSSVVIAGDAAAVAEVCAALAGRGIRSVPLQVSHAFHSRRMEPMLAAFRAHLRAVKLRPPRLPIVSNLSGAPAGAELADPEYWVRQVRSPVRFAEGVARLAVDGATALLEVGPGTALTGLARECLRGQTDPPTVLASLGRDPDDWTPVLTALARLWTLGATIDWEATRAGQARVHVPPTPLERQRHAPVPGPSIAASPARASGAAEVSPARASDAAEASPARASGAAEVSPARASDAARPAGDAAEMLAALHGGRISVGEAMDALLRRRS